MEKEMVSVIIPTYGRAKYLERAVDSVLRQSYEQIEIIVVDDNGDDTAGRRETEIVMQKYEQNPNINYITYEKNMNGSHARNVGIKASSGKYIAFLDDDDEMKEDKIRLQVETLSALDDSWGASYTGYYVSKGKLGHEISCENRAGDLYFEALARSLFICGGSNLLIKREVVDTIGFFDESFKRNQDVEFLARILKKYKIAYVDSMQLIIHLENQEERSAARSYVNGIVIDEFYLSKFNKEIESLDMLHRKRLFQYFALERFKRSIGEKELRDGLANLVKQRVSPLLFFKYVFYLVNRKRKHLIYGFRLL